MRLINWIVRLLALTAIFGLSACDQTSRIAQSGAAGSEQSGATDSSMGSAVTAAPSVNRLPELRNNAVYHLEIGDQLSVTLTGIQEATQLGVEVDENGMVNMPYVNDVKAAGKSVALLARDIQKAYVDEKIYKSITVNISTPELKYSIGGHIKREGSYPFEQGMTLLHAIMAAGGYDDYADPKKVYILRSGVTTRLNAYEMRLHPEKDVKIGVKDVIYVEKKWY